MKKWFNRHRKKIFAILCIFTILCSSFIFVSADDTYNTNYNLPQIYYNIGGVSPDTFGNDLLVGFGSVSKYCNDYLEFPYPEGEDSTVTVESESYFDYYTFEYFVNVYSYDLNFTESSFLVLSDFYIDSEDTYSMRFFCIVDSNSIQSCTVDLYYSSLGSDVVNHNTYSLTSDSEGYFTLPKFDDVIYVSSVVVEPVIDDEYTDLSLNATINTNTLYNGRIADISASSDGGGILDSIFTVITSVAQWIVSSFLTVVSLFFVDGKFTIIGILSIIATGISIVLLIVSIITAYLRFRR